MKYEFITWTFINSKYIISRSISSSGISNVSIHSLGKKSSVMLLYSLSKFIDLFVYVQNVKCRKRAIQAEKKLKLNFGLLGECNILSNKKIPKQTVWHELCDAKYYDSKALS